MVENLKVALMVAVVGPIAWFSLCVLFSLGGGM